MLNAKPWTASYWLRPDSSPAAHVVRSARQVSPSLELAKTTMSRGEAQWMAAVDVGVGESGDRNEVTIVWRLCGYSVMSTTRMMPSNDIKASSLRVAFVNHACIEEIHATSGALPSCRESVSKGSLQVASTKISHPMAQTMK